MNLLKKIFLIPVIFSELTTILVAFELVDSTKEINDTIVGILESFENINASDVLKNLVTENHPEPSYNGTWTTYEVESFIFRELKTIQVHSNETSIGYRYGNNSIHIYSPSLTVKYGGYVRPNDASPYSRDEKYFDALMNLVNCTIRGHAYAAHPSHPPHMRCISYTYDDLHVVLAENQTVPQPDSILPLLLGQIISSNGRKTHFSKKGYGHFRPEKWIGREYENFFRDKQYYYKTQNISFGSVDLTNTVLLNFPNLRSVQYDDQSGTVSLLINGFTGRTNVRKILDLGSKIELLWFLWDFKIGSLEISVNSGRNRINIEAREVSLFESFHGNNTGYNGSGAFHLIEYTIASTIFPSMKFESKKCLSASIREAENCFAIPSTTSMSTKTYDDDKSTRKLTEDEQTTSTTPNNNYLTVTINVPPGKSQYPKHIQCPVLNSTTFTHRINLDSFWKKGLNGSGPRSIDISFRFNLPSLNISVIEPSTINNSSNVNDSCQFQIRNDNDIKVEIFTQTKNGTQSGPSTEQQLLKVEKKINATLLSLMKERIVRTMTPIVGAPFDVCAQAVKMVDDFFQQFANDVLNKCLFRKKNNK